MAEIYPFRACRYNPKKVPDLARVVTQPYDKITPEMQARYYELSPYNLARIIRGVKTPTESSEENVYTRARRDFHHWLDERVLIPERAPALYPYSQEYLLTGRGYKRKRRRGFVGLCRLEDYAAGVVHRHEETLAAPRADRLELLKATRAHFGQIFALYSDPRGEIEHLLGRAAAGRPLESVEDEYATYHSIWRLTDPATIEEIVAAMRDKKLVIADGHHRYETALGYRDLRRAASPGDERSELVMMTFVRMEDPGLIIRPTHRVLHSLPQFAWNEFLVAVRKYFDWKDFHVQGRAQQWGSRLVRSLAAAGNDGTCLAGYGGPGRLVLLRLRSDLKLERVLAEIPDGLRRLDVVLLHRLILGSVLEIDLKSVREEKNLRYVSDLELAIQQVNCGQAQAAFLLNPTPIEAVRENALAGAVLPQKSTDFYPKLLSGLVIYWLDNPAGL